MRPRAEAERTARRLRALGHEAVIAPVLDVRPTGRPLPAGRFDGLVAASARVFAARPTLPEAWLAHPFFAVGRQTAEAARTAGFGDVRTGAGGGAALAALVVLTLPRPARLLCLVGRDRKPVLEAALREAGFAVVTAEVYAAAPVEHWPGEALHALAAGSVDAALHYSRRSAALALRTGAAAGLVPELLRLRHVCLSDDCAKPLRDAGAERIDIAGEPEETALLTLLPPAGRADPAA